MSEEQVKEVVDFENRLYELDLSATLLPRATEFFIEQRELGETLKPIEDIWEKKINTTRLGVGYFQTEEGKKLAADLLGFTDSW